MAASMPQTSPAPKGTQRSSREESSNTSSPTTSAVQLRGRDLTSQDALLAPDAGGFDAQAAALAPVQRDGGGGNTAGVHQAAAHGVQGGGGQLPHMDRIQQSFGHHDVSGINAHVGGRATEATQAMGAEAYATGNDVAFGKSPDLHTAAHEAAHIVQQRSGVSLSGGVGKAGDPYEQHADSVADKVVKGESAAGLLDQMSGGGGGGATQKRDVQRKADDQRGGGQQLEQKHEFDKADKEDTSIRSLLSPEKHPYFPIFQTRVVSAFARVDGAPKGKNAAAIAKEIWAKVLGAMKNSAVAMSTKDPYSDPDKGYVDMNSPAFKKVLGEFDGVLSQLAGYTSSQMNKAMSFGFWSTGVGRALSEKICDVTLETSGLGNLFDGIPTIDGIAKCGWDVHLWGGLSHAYATAVGDQIGKKGKRVHVCLGPGARKDNIWAAVESKAVAVGAAAVGKTLQQVCTYHAAAPTVKWGGDLDTTQKGGEFDGTVFSGDEATARKKADDHNATLP